MKEIKKLIKENVPFAIVQYYSSFKLWRDEVIKNYELLYLTSSKKLMSIKLDRSETNYLKSLDGMKLVTKNEHGTIWEIHNFQEYYHKNKKPKRVKKSKVIGNENN